jgi:hypothetical protein
MRSRPAACLLLALSLPAALLVATPASAKWNKEVTQETSQITTTPTWIVGGIKWQCAQGDFTGIVATPSAMSGKMSFTEPCSAGLITGSVTCKGTFTMTVADSAETLVDVELDAGSSCTVTVMALCTVTITGPQSFPGTGFFNETTTTLTHTFTFSYTRTGSSLCGPASGTGTFQASWNVTPSDLAIV